MKKFNQMIEKNYFNDILFKLNEKGLFDEYSDDHFLIKALNGKMDYFDRYKNLVKNSMYYSTEDMNVTNFILNFSSKLKSFCSHFTDADMENFIKNQLSAGKNNYKEEQFFRAVSEINVINFLMSFGPAHLSKTIYEPKLGQNGSNPESRLIYENGVIVDVEVKTPGFNKKTNGDEKAILIPTLLLDNNCKLKFKKKCNKYGIEFILPRVSKLKDYINSAGKKFEFPQNKNHINLLFINWTYTDVEQRGYLEPYSLLYNNLNGILKNKEVALSIGISESALEKISAIIIYQDTFNSLIFGDFRYAWEGYNFRMLPNMLMDKRHIDIKIIKDSTRMNPPKFRDNMMPYELEVSKKCFRYSFEDVFKVTEYINRIVKSKIKKNDNFTYFDKRYYQKMLKENRKKLKNITKLKQLGYIKDKFY